MPRKIFEFQERLATGNCRNVHNEELLEDLYSLANIIWGDKNKENEMGEECGTRGGTSEMLTTFW